MLNETILCGRLTRDPEIRMVAGNVPMTSFTLAVDRDIKNSDGARTTDFIDCSVWRRTAEFVAKNFSKGSLMIIKGRLQSREWTDGNGGKRRGIELIADNVYFGDRRVRKDGEAEAPAEAPSDAF